MRVHVTVLAGGLIVGLAALPAPAQEVDPPQAEPAPVEAAEAGVEFPLGLDGYCPVTLHESRQWVEGEADCELNYRGRCYRFASHDDLQRFEGNPDHYAPVAKGYDVVALANGQTVEGERSHGVFYDGVIYLFASEKHLRVFWNDPLQCTVEDGTP